MNKYILSEFGKLNQGEIGKLLDIKPATVTNQGKSMEAKGLIKHRRGHIFFIKNIQSLFNLIRSEIYRAFFSKVVKPVFYTIKIIK